MLKIHKNGVGKWELMIDQNSFAEDALWGGGLDQESAISELWLNEDKLTF